MRYGSLAVVSASSLLFGLCLTLLFFGMRGIMELGGFVAVGGPYEIAHPAPDWVWVLPVSIVGGMLAVGVNMIAAGRVGGFTLVLPAWCALFLSLGWNFLEFGLWPPGGGTAWGWLVSAIAFFLMGLGPLVIVALGGWELWPTEGWLKGRPRLTHGAGFIIAYTILVVVSVGVGVFLGMSAFSSVST